MANKLDAFFKSYADTEEQVDHKVASDKLGERVPSFSTNSIILDDATSCGGFPEGRITQLYGRNASGKTLMAMLGIKSAQQADPTAWQMFIDAEQTFSPDWAETLGLDTARILVIDGDTAVNGRKLFEMLLGVPKEDAKHILKGKSKQGFLDQVIAKEDGFPTFNMIVLDSLGAIIPPGEDTAAVGKHNMSLMARFLTTTFRKLALEVTKAKIPFIVINHTKDNMDPYGADHTFSGGNTFAHFLSLNIFFEAVQRKDAQILDDKENKVGHIIRATIEKSKFGPHPKKCEFKVNFGQGVVDVHEEIATLAADYGVVQKPSTVRYEYGDNSWVGAAKFSEAIEADPVLAAELKEKIVVARESRWTRLLEEQAVKKAAAMEAAENAAKAKAEAKASKKKVVQDE
jgi:recombination protein RecA